MNTLEIARELGMSLSESEEFHNVLNARKNVAEDTELTKLIATFHQKREDLVNIMQSPDVSKNDALEASADMERIQEQLLENPLFSTLLSAEQEFQNLIAAVNKEISSFVDVESNVECSGNCSSCSGCTH